MTDGPTLISVADGMDYLLRPIHEGFTTLESLHRKELDLNDFAEANAYLDAYYENRERVRKWAEDRAVAPPLRTR